MMFLYIIIEYHTLYKNSYTMQLLSRFTSLQVIIQSVNQYQSINNPLHCAIEAPINQFHINSLSVKTKNKKEKMELNKGYEMMHPMRKFLFSGNFLL